MEYFCITPAEGESGAPVEWEVGTPITEPPPPDARSLSSEVIAGMTIPVPVVAFGPDAALVAVKVPVWMWVENDTRIIDSATDRGLTVTVTAELDSLDLGMGAPNVRGYFDRGKPEARVHCDTVPTTGPPPEVTREDVPPCGYTYVWRSLSERTGGTCRWPVTITANWAITWSASNGESGNLDLTRNGATALLVREWRTQLVSPDYRHDPQEWLAQQRETPPCT